MGINRLTISGVVSRINSFPYANGIGETRFIKLNCGTRTNSQGERVPNIVDLKAFIKDSSDPGVYDLIKPGYDMGFECHVDNSPKVENGELQWVKNNVLVIDRVEFLLDKEMQQLTLAARGVRAQARAEGAQAKANLEGVIAAVRAQAGLPAQPQAQPQVAPAVAPSVETVDSQGSRRTVPQAPVKTRRPAPKPVPQAQPDDLVDVYDQDIPF